MATLQRLGEDIEICLKQLVFGTVRISLRMQIAEEMRKYGYLGSYEWKMLERMSLLQVCDCYKVIFVILLIASMCSMFEVQSLIISLISLLCASLSGGKEALP